MNEAETSAEHIDPALAAAGWGKVEGSRVLREHNITADTDLRLCRYFGLSDGWWLRGQMECDMAFTKAKMRSVLAAIQPRNLSIA